MKLERLNRDETKIGKLKIDRVKIERLKRDQTKIGKIKIDRMK